MFTSPSLRIAKSIIRGFSLVELMVAMALFSVVSVIVVGSVVVLIGVNQRTQSDQQVSVGLSAALDMMTREIRMGSYYHCASSFTSIHQLGETTQASCDNGNIGLSFREATSRLTQGRNNDRIAFYFEPANSGAPGRIMRKISEQNAEPITPSTIAVDNARFFVTGTPPLSSSNNVIQPTVTIVIIGRNLAESDQRPFQIQTTVIQRQLDL